MKLNRGGACVLIIVVLATATKWVLNTWEIGFAEIAMIPSRTSDEARRRQTFICNVTIEPKEFFWKGQQFRFAEAWLEKQSRLDYYLVWFPKYRLIGGNVLCFFLKDGNDGLFHKEAHFVMDEDEESFSELYSNSRPILFWHIMAESEIRKKKLRLLENWADPCPRVFTVTTERK